MREIDQVINYWRANQLAGKPTALASVVFVEGSSYRRPGARMLVTPSGKVAGAVSGGCVERAVAVRAMRVIETGIPEMMVYDGRHRLGCNGSLHILIEPFAPVDADGFYGALESTKGSAGPAGAPRQSFTISSAFAKTLVADSKAASRPKVEYSSLGSNLSIRDEVYSLRAGFSFPTTAEKQTEVFSNEIKPAPQLYVVGTEYDATVLAKLAASQAWEATLITHPRNPLEPIEGITVQDVDPPTLLDHLILDDQTALVLMSHNYARDLAYLTALSKAPQLRYLGLLGPAKRRDQLLNDLTETNMDLPEWMTENIYGPAGIDLGGELPEQIGLSIMAEVVAVFAQRSVPSLREKRGFIHE
jgi:xanthine/CO dehydrogenase XdhC/CoxF family maturation factor